MAELRGVVLGRCRDCLGVWCDPGEIEALVPNPRAEDRAPRAVLPPLATEAHRRCPRCDRAMLKQNYARLSGVRVDVCGPHGTFLDAGELEKIVRFLEAGGAALRDAARREELEREDANRRRVESLRVPLRGLRVGLGRFSESS